MIHSWNYWYDSAVANKGFNDEEASEYADANMELELKAAWGPAAPDGAGTASSARPVPWLSGAKE